MEMLQKFGSYLLIISVTMDYLQALSLTSSVEEAGRHAACPGEEVVFTCSVRQSLFLEWSSDLFQDTIRQTPSNQIGQPISHGEFQVELINITNRILRTANMISILRVVGNDAAHLNGTVVNCTEVTTAGTFTEGRTVYIAVPPSSPRSPSHFLQSHTDDSATVSVRWEQPESDGWAGIEHFNITVTGVTISVSGSNTMAVLPTPLPYNHEITVHITASNCAGKSSNAELTFTIVNCIDPCHPARGTLEVYDSTLEGSEVFYYCSEGLVPEERLTATCGADGNWSPNPAELVCLADCGAPQIPPNAVVHPYNSTIEGSTVTYLCRSGYVPPMQMMASCSTEGKWIPNPTDHMCLVDCGDPAPPPHGTLVQYSSTLEGSVVVYYCNEGLVPSVVMTAVCAANGSWTPNSRGLNCRKSGEVDTEAAGETTIVTVVIVALVSSLLSFATGVVVGGLVCYWFTRKERKIQCVSCPKEEARPSVYEDVGPPRVDIEMKENVAYGPVLDQ